MNGVCSAESGRILWAGSSVNIRERSDMNSILSTDVSIASLLSILVDSGGRWFISSNDLKIYLRDSFEWIPVS